MKLKRILSVLLCAAVLAVSSAIPAMASSPEDFTVESGVLTAYTGTDTVVTIPDDVTSIADSAFRDNASITSVTIPSSVTNIDDGAFADCPSLTGITVDDSNANYSSDSFGALFNKDKTTLIQYPIGNTRTSYSVPSTVTTINIGAFEGCTSLTAIDLSSCTNLTEIDDFAFRGCEGLISIDIPSTVTSIGSAYTGDTYTGDVFIDCESLVSITVDENNENYSSDSFGVLFNKDKSELISCTISNPCNSYTIPDSVTSISKNAFGDCTALQTVTFPTGEDCKVTTIGDGAFSFSGITSIDIPSTVTHIGDDSFEGCNSLTGITADDNNTYTCDDGVLFNSDKSALIQYPGAKEDPYTIPSTVTSIGHGAFDCLTHLQSVSFADANLTSLPKDIFMYCTALSTVTLSDKITSIGDSAFKNCRNLSTVTFPTTLTTIGDFAFFDSGITSITIPASVTSIGDGAFALCATLTGIAVDGSNANYSSDSYGVLFNKGKTELICYPNGNAQDSYTVPTSVQTIDAGSFNGAVNLATVTIQSGTETIGVTAFYGCSDLTSITIPDSVTSIGDSAFSGCADGFTIHCAKNSTADTYAADNSLSCVYTDKKFTSFSIGSSTGTINESNHTISVSVPSGTNLTSLKATFTTTGKSVSIGATEQTSGSTNNDFSSPVIYKVTADDNSTVNYTVTVTVYTPSAPSAPTTPPDTTVTGTTTTTNTDGTTVSTATITPTQTNTSTVSNVIVKLDTVTVTAPSTVLSSILGSDTTSTLKLTQEAPPAATQAQLTVVAESSGVTPVASLNIDLAKVSSSGTSEAVHNLNGSISVTVKLTDEQLAAITDASKAKLLYYNPDTGALQDMGATFDLAAKTVTFSTNHFSTYLIATASAAANVGVTYNAHVQNIGWQTYVSDGAEAGTDGKSLRVEAVNIKLTGSVPTGASITYSAHVQNVGWQKAVSNGITAGTFGKSLRVEALKITLGGMPGYSVKYRVHVQNKGWLDWQTTANGTSIDSAAIAGTTGKSLRVEAVEIQLVKTTV